MAEMKLSYWDGKGAGKSRGRAARKRVFLWTFVAFLFFVISMIVLPGSGSMPMPKTKAAKGDISALKTALLRFELDNGRIPTAREGIGALVADPGGLPNWQPRLDRVSVPLDPWGRPYIYRIPGKNDQEFEVYSVGSDGVDETADDVHDVDSLHR